MELNQRGKTALTISVCVGALPDDGGHDLCSEQDAEGGGGLGGEKTQH